MNAKNRLYRAPLDLARQAHARIGASDLALYEAHHNYKLALAFAGKRSHEGIDHIQFKDAENQLIEKVIDVYRNAYALMRDRGWRDADDTWTRLSTDIYPDNDSLVWKNVQEQRSLTSANTPGRRFR